VKNHIKAVSRVALVAVVVVVIVAAAVGGLFLTGVLTTQEQKRQIIIGLSLPLTNPVGIHAKYAAEMAVEEINQAGGVVLNGTKYELVLVAEDTNEMDPLIPVDQGVTAFKRLVEVHGAHVIVGRRQDGHRSSADTATFTVQNSIPRHRVQPAHSRGQSLLRLRELQVLLPLLRRRT
jgi:hypothetical protein